MASVPYLPNVKTLERKFGGIVSIRRHLGIQNADYRSGEERSQTATRVGRGGFSLEESVYHRLVNLFHEPFVHNQARIVVGEQHLKVDFIVYHKQGRFAVDVFYPDTNRQRYSNNIALKYKTYFNFPLTLYLCIGNEEITEDMIVQNIKSKN